MFIYRYIYIYISTCIQRVHLVQKVQAQVQIQPTRPSTRKLLRIHPTTRVLRPLKTRAPPKLQSTKVK